MPRIVFQLVLILLPFLAFGVYRVAIAEAKQEGRKPWPIKMLFAIGLGLFLVSWLVLIVINRGGRNECVRPAHLENGVLIPQVEYECEKDRSSLGVPRSKDPGGQARGVSDNQAPDAEQPDE